METFDIFICCGGKCGGTTLANTFNKNGYKTTHLHSSKHLGNFKSNIDINHTFDIIDESCKQKKIYILDSYRNPIERKISCFFQKIKQYLPNYQDLSMEELTKYFNNNILTSCVAEHHPINEFLQKYDIPLFNKFNFKRHYNIAEKNNIVFVKILFSDISEWDKILSEVFNNKIVIYPANLTQEKEMGNLYKQFKDQYRIPRSYLNIVKNDTEFQIYNKPYEQHKYLNMWGKLSTN